MVKYVNQDNLAAKKSDSVIDVINLGAITDVAANLNFELLVYLPAYWSNPGCKAHIGGWAVGQADPVFGKLVRLSIIQHAAVSKPAIVLIPSYLPIYYNPIRIPIPI
jgi:hypothetical protein